MKQVNVHDAKTQLSRLLTEVEAGEEVVISRAGTPVARLVPYEVRREPRVFGSLKGQIWISDDFDAPLPEDTEAAFQGECP